MQTIRCKTFGIFPGQIMCLPTLLHIWSHLHAIRLLLRRVLAKQQVELMKLPQERLVAVAASVIIYHVHLRVLALTKGDGFRVLKHSYSREYTIHVILCQLLLVGIRPTVQDAAKCLWTKDIGNGIVHLRPLLISNCILNNPQHTKLSV